MNKVKVLVIEDEVIIADNLCNIIDSLGYEALEPVLSYNEALEVLQNNKVDIAIIDIQISGSKSGIDVAKTINENYNIPFIYLTSNSDKLTIEQAKQTQPSAYLVKPFTAEDIYPAIEVTIHNFAKQQQLKEENVIFNNALFYKEKGVYKKIFFSDILFIKSDHVYIDIFLKNNVTQIIRISLTDILNKLNSNFLRVHRGYVINTNFIDKLDSKSIKIENYNIPIGKTYKDAVIGAINKI